MYQWQKQIKAKPQKSIVNFLNSFGPVVLTREADGRAKSIKFSVYLNKKYCRIKLIGPFNNWGKTTESKDWLLKPQADNKFYALTVSSKYIKHKTPYLFLYNGMILRDPATVFFDKDGNSIFWDFQNKENTKLVAKPDLYNNSLRILQTDLPGFISHFKAQKGKYKSKKGHQINESNIYDFISESGVIETISKLGFNAIQFLPLAQSIDGGKWSYRYLVPYLYSINSYWGTPDDFKKMVAKFHEANIAVIIDFVSSHAPYKDYTLFAKPADDIGLHCWSRPNDDLIFLADTTNWGTKRYKLQDPFIRQFIIESALHFIKNYNVDGFRIDNVDGIIRYGDNGDGKERPNGRKFLRELTTTIYEYAPKTIFHFEAHYFYKNNAKRLVQSTLEHKNALGATSYTSSRLTHFFHTEYMPFSADKISPWKIKHITDEKEWGESNSTIADFHNHDASSGLIEMRATGSYAYDALTLGKKDLHFHAIGKIKIMEALISFFTEGRTLDLLQSFLLQKGTFDHDSSIHWHLYNKKDSKSMVDFKKAINLLLNNSYYNLSNTKHRKILNIDDKAKTITLLRTDANGKNGHIIFLNLSSTTQNNYFIPVIANANYNLIFNGDKSTYSGTNLGKVLINQHPQKVNLFEFYDLALQVEYLPAYAVFVFSF